MNFLMWDNFSCHKTAYVTNIIYDRGTANEFLSVDHPPYCPKMTPIEYIFCELACELSRRVNVEWDMDNLRRIIMDI